MSALVPQDVPIEESTILHGPPWVTVQGIFNIRSLGGYPVAQASSNMQSKSIRPSWIFRSAEPSRITKQGIKELKALGIKKMYDLRSEPELEKMATITPLVEIDGVTREFVPIFRREDYSPEALAIRYKAYRAGVEGFIEAYKSILESGPESFRKILEHVRDAPQEPFIIHCTAGKDRTGVICALILGVAGVDDNTIANEYELTTLGLEPMHKTILEHLRNENALGANADAAENMLSSRKPAMTAVLQHINETYGGAKGYLTRMCKFSEEDVQKMRDNLIVDEPPYVKLADP